MNKRMMFGISLVTVLSLVLLLGACGGGDETASQAESETPATEATPAETVTETVAANDCAGGCGMKAVPQDQMTEIEGKWYCAGCAKKAQAEETEEGHGQG